MIYITIKKNLNTRETEVSINTQDEKEVLDLNTMLQANCDGWEMQSLVPLSKESIAFAAKYKFLGQDDFDPAVERLSRSMKIFIRHAYQNQELRVETIIVDGSSPALIAADLMEMERHLEDEPTANHKQSGAFFDDPEKHLELTEEDSKAQPEFSVRSSFFSEPPKGISPKVLKVISHQDISEIQSACDRIRVLIIEELNLCKQQGLFDDKTLDDYHTFSFLSDKNLFLMLSKPIMASIISSAESSHAAYTPLFKQRKIIATVITALKSGELATVGEIEEKGEVDKVVLIGGYLQELKKAFASNIESNFKLEKLKLVATLQARLQILIDFYAPKIPAPAESQKKEEFSGANTQQSTGNRQLPLSEHQELAPSEAQESQRSLQMS